MIGHFAASLGKMSVRGRRCTHCFGIIRSEMRLDHPDTILPIEMPRLTRSARKRSGPALILALLFLFVSLASISPAGAATPAATAWWWRPQGAAGGILFPTPPSVPADGLAVGGAPDGPTAVAAVRYALFAGETPLTLSLVTSNEAGADGAVIWACPAGGPWEPVQAGKWETRPQAACGVASVTGKRSPDGKSWTFDVSSLASLTVQGFLDIVLQPGTVSTPGGSVSTTFQISFSKPGTSSLATDQAPSTTPAEFEYAPLQTEGVFESSVAATPLSSAPLETVITSGIFPEVGEPAGPTQRGLASGAAAAAGSDVPASSRFLFPIVLAIAAIHFVYAFGRSRRQARLGA